VSLFAGADYVWTQTADGLHELNRAWGPEVAQTDEQQKSPVVQQVAAQLERLLYLAYHLQLAPLQEVLHGFTRQNCTFRNSILYGHMETVLSPRVVQASVSGGMAKQALLQALVQQAWPLGAGRCQGLFVPAGGPESSSLEFRASLAQPLPGLAAHEVQDFKLDFPSSALEVGPKGYGVTLCVGPKLTLPGTTQAVLGEAAAAQDPAPPAPAE